MRNSNGSVQAARDSDNMLKLLVGLCRYLCCSTCAAVFTTSQQRECLFGVSVLPDCSGRTESTYALGNRLRCSRCRVADDFSPRHSVQIPLCFSQFCSMLWCLQGNFPPWTACLRNCMPMTVTLFPTRCPTNPAIAVILLNWHFFQPQKFIISKIKGSTEDKLFIHLYADAWEILEKKLNTPKRID